MRDRLSLKLVINIIVSKICWLAKLLICRDPCPCRDLNNYSCLYPSAFSYIGIIFYALKEFPEKIVLVNKVVELSTLAAHGRALGQTLRDPWFHSCLT